jgi:hypothetical protein
LFQLFDVVNLQAHTYVLPLTLVAAGALDEYQVAQLVRIYVNGPTNPIASCGRSVQIGQAVCSITISGYLLNK